MDLTTGTVIISWFNMKDTLNRSSLPSFIVERAGTTVHLNHLTAFGAAPDKQAQALKAAMNETMISTIKSHRSLLRLR